MVFAANLLEASRDDEQRLDAAFERALARHPNSKEKQSLLNFLSVQREHYKKDRDEAALLMKVGFSKSPADIDQIELAAWTQVCRVILNLHEVITVY